MSGDDEIDAAYARYFRDFQTLSPDAVAPHFHLPSAMVTPAGVVLATTVDEVSGLFAGMMSGLRDRGYGSTDLVASRVRRLATGLAELTITAVRRRTDGSELERIGATYVFRLSEARWRIAVITVHDPDV